MYTEFLRKVPLFAELPDEDLNYICQTTQEVHLAPGEELFAEGSTGDLAYILEKGELEIIKQIDGRPVLLAVRGEPGDIIGEMALLVAAPRMASVRARTPTTMLALHHDKFNYLLSNPTAARIMLQTVLSRWRFTESLLNQNEKMAQLGTLSAGIAHELNNPAAAVRRGADQLSDLIAEAQTAHAQLFMLDLTDEQQAALQTLAQQAQERTIQRMALSALERSDREAALESWLDDRGIDDSWELAPALVNLGYEINDLEALTRQFAPEQFTPLVRWLSAQGAVYTLLAEIGEGAQRISDIVQALRTYVHLDQAPIQTVDVHQGLDNTLLILRSKLGSGVTVQREYSPDLPKIEAYASELNQVWTNLIDNAVDAMDGQGQITIRSRREGDWVVVEIEDNGPGIPPEHQERIFDSFFTTKPPGQGSGLGLHTTYNIVVRKHRGDIKVFSRPGATCFQVWLPINFEAIPLGAEPG